MKNKALCFILVLGLLVISITGASSDNLSGMVELKNTANLHDSVEDLFSWLDDYSLARANLCYCVLQDLEEIGFELPLTNGKSIAFLGYDLNKKSVNIYVRGADDQFRRICYLPGEPFGILIDYGMSTAKAYNELKKYCTSPRYKVSEDDLTELALYFSEYPDNKYYIPTENK